MKTKHATPFLNIVKPAPSEDVIDLVRWLMVEAAAGRLTGLAIAGTFTSRQYMVETAGEANENPLFGLGAIKMLEHELTQRIADAYRQ